MYVFLVIDVIIASDQKANSKFIATVAQHYKLATDRPMGRLSNGKAWSYGNFSVGS